MDTFEAFEKGVIINDISYQCAIMQLPKGIGNDKTIIEIRRSHLQDAAFIVITDGKPKVVEQTDIWKEIKALSEQLFNSFGVYTPVIIWKDDLEALVQRRIEIEAGKKSLGQLFG